MQQFFMEYGLYLLIALMIGIAVIFLLTRGRKSGAAVEDSPAPAATEQGPATPAATPETLVVPDPVPVIAVPPLPLADTATAAEEIDPEPSVSAPPPAPVTPAQTAVHQPASDTQDDLLRMKGVGPKLKAQLTQLGVTSFAQIAAWTESDIAAIDAELGAFKGRPVRDQWIDQAKYLAAGDIAGFEAKYGKI